MACGDVPPLQRPPIDMNIHAPAAAANVHCWHLLSRASTWA